MIGLMVLAFLNGAFAVLNLSIFRRKNFSVGCFNAFTCIICILTAVYA